MEIPPTLKAFLDELGIRFICNTFEGQHHCWMENRLVDLDMSQEATADLDADKAAALAADMTTLAENIRQMS